MTMKQITLLLLCLLPLLSNSQELTTELNGFRIGQYREVPKNELKTILQKDKFEDGFEYEAYLVEPDTSVYMIFEYANYDLETIWSIQLTGNKIGYDGNFKGLKLGMTSDEVTQILGKPSSIVDIGEYGKRWEYNNTNYSLEINPKGLLSSIKITDKSQEFYPKQDLSKIPSFKQFSEILNSQDRKKIIEILAPGLEIYKDNATYYFRNSIAIEIKNDNSSIFKLIEEMKDIINKTNPDDRMQYEENMRVTEKLGTMHVAKFKSKDRKSEIVFKYMFGKYMIWEIKIN